MPSAKQSGYFRLSGERDCPGGYINVQFLDQCKCGATAKIIWLAVGWRFYRWQSTWRNVIKQWSLKITKKTRIFCDKSIQRPVCIRRKQSYFKSFDFKMNVETIGELDESNFTKKDPLSTRIWMSKFVFTDPTVYKQRNFKRAILKIKVNYIAILRQRCFRCGWSSSHS